MQIPGEIPDSKYGSDRLSLLFFGCAIVIFFPGLPPDCNIYSLFLPRVSFLDYSVFHPLFLYIFFAPIWASEKYSIDDTCLIVSAKFRFSDAPRCVAILINSTRLPTLSRFRKYLNPGFKCGNFIPIASFNYFMNIQSILFVWESSIRKTDLVRNIKNIKYSNKILFVQKC